MAKRWMEMTKKELEEAFLKGYNFQGVSHKKDALLRLRTLWRQEDSRTAQFAKTISIWAIDIAGLTFLATVGWWVWTLYVWTRGGCVG